MTQCEFASNHKVTPLMRKIARNEGVSAKIIAKLIAEGKIVILNNNQKEIRNPCAVGKGLRTKINANIGTSSDCIEIKDELEKLEVSIKYGADAVMDLSVAGDLQKIRKKIIDNSSVPVGTVPVYESAVIASLRKGTFLNMTKEDIFDVLEAQARQGVDFFTIHAGINIASLKVLKRSKRILDIVSRGGAILACWMNYHKKENPYYEYFDQILDIAYRYDITLSLGDALRPGSVCDATDEAQIYELKILAQLAERARKKKVSVIIEGPGHVPLHQIPKNIILQKKICKGIPFYVLGPLVTDIGMPYDHISAAIGGAIAASYGADFLCYVTPAEHLRHPTLEDVKDGVIASRIAAHAADLAKGVKSAWRKDKKISLYRKKRDWAKQIAFCVDPKKAFSYRSLFKLADSKVCTMCGKYCSIKLFEDYCR